MVELTNEDIDVLVKLIDGLVRTEGIRFAAVGANLAHKLTQAQADANGE